jgi:protoporphyrinogen oxidase
MKNYYDMVIIGAGPAGLALAHCCSRLGISILIIDKESAIGGCHRVIRTDQGLFTEHSPRIYFENYVNVMYLMSEMGLRQEDVFIPYKYSLFDIISKLLPYISWYDVIIFAFIHIVYFINIDYGHDISLETFCKQFGVSPKLTEKLDRICRFVDGADIRKYSVNKFLSLSNMVSQILQPNQPLDTSLFKVWKEYLETKNIDFALGQQVSNIHYNKHLHKIDYVVIDNKYTVHLNRLVLAVPPVSISHILKKNPDIQNAFGDFHAFKDWSEKTEYNEYVSLTYHFKDNINLPEINGATIDTDWGIIVIVLSDYMKNIESGYQSLLSIGISMPDNPSKFTGKTANQCTQAEIFAEVYRQLRHTIYRDLPDDYHAVLNPTNYYRNNEWHSGDEAYFHTIGTDFLPYQSNNIKNLYNTGVQNGHSHSAYTTMESAVSNSMVLACQLYPQLRPYYFLRRSTQLREWLLYGLIIICLIICLLYMAKNTSFGG